MLFENITYDLNAGHGFDVHRATVELSVSIDDLAQNIPLTRIYSAGGFVPSRAR